MFIVFPEFVFRPTFPTLVSTLCSILTININILLVASLDISYVGNGLWFGFSLSEEYSENTTLRFALLLELWTSLLSALSS